MWLQGLGFLQCIVRKHEECESNQRSRSLPLPDVNSSPNTKQQQGVLTGTRVKELRDV